MKKKLVREMLRQRLVKLNIAMLLTVGSPFVWSSLLHTSKWLLFLLYLPPLLLTVYPAVWTGGQAGILAFTAFYGLELFYLYGLLTILERVIIEVKERF